MIWDVTLFGLYVNAGLATCVAAAGATLFLRRLLARAGAYTWLWHPVLVDLSIFTLTWAAIVGITMRVGPSILFLIA